MSNELKITPINPITPQLDEFAVEARMEGYSFVDRLINEAQSGRNVFSRKGECFCGVFVDEKLVECGGINIEPYAKQMVGRLRHVYVLKRYRRAGIASALVRDLLERSKVTFNVVRLRTSDKSADMFYEALGLSRVDDESATHMIKLKA